MDKNYCTIYIVRHGETEWNVKKLVQGQTDIPLNKKGESQAKDLGKNLKKIKFDAVYSSDLLRAKQTAQLIMLEKKLAVETSELLRERRFGKLEGQTRDQANKIYKIWEDLNLQQRLSFRPFKRYETDNEVITRFITFVREVAASRLRQTILVVTHGAVMRIFLNHLSGQTFSNRAVGNSGYVKLKSDGVDFFIEELVNIEKPNA